LKVLNTVEHYPPHIGGAERVVQRVSEGLVLRGHEVIVATSGDRSSECINGVHVERFPVSGNTARGIHGDTRALIRLIEETEPDLVFNYAAQTWTTDTCAELLDSERKYALVLAPCGFSGLYEARYRQYFDQMKTRLLRYDALIFHSSVYRDWAFAVSVGASRVHVIPNGADEVPEVSGSHGGDLIALTIGSHVRSKGHSDFVDAVRRMRQQLRVQGIIVAPPRRGLDFFRGCQPHCFAESLRGGGAIEFWDGREAGVVRRALSRAHLLLLPSQIECAPLVVLEAMAARVPWIAYDVGNVRELAGGLVVDNLEHLVEVALDLLGSSIRREELGAQGNEAWQRHHQWHDVIEEYASLFLRVVGGQNAAAAQA
jgi:L-malate glycosyltransferase